MTKLIIDVKKGRAKKFKKHLEEEHPSTRGRIRIKNTEFIDSKDEHDKAVALFAKIGISIDPEALCSELSVAQQQTVEIAKALAENAKLIVMDEPSATLTGQEVTKLFEIIKLFDVFISQQAIF